ISFATKCIDHRSNLASPLMRPPLLNPLFAPITSLAGIGPKQDRLFRHLLDREDTARILDLLLHLPASVIDRRARPKIRDAQPGTVVTLEVTVDRHRPTPGRNARAPHLVYASDDTGDVVLTYFRSPPGHGEKLLPVGAKPDGPFWPRLAFDELLAGQLALALVRAQLRRPAGDRHAGDGHLRHKIIDALPYSLTSSQQQAAAAITEDLRQPVRMLRLLQGDVGSGTTVVALLVAAAVAEAGKPA